jgi:hypothetical protein
MADEQNPQSASKKINAGGSDWTGRWDMHHCMTVLQTMGDCRRFEFRLGLHYSAISPEQWVPGVAT